MAFKKYGYYLKGNKIAVIEQSDATSGGNLAIAHCTVDPTNNTTKDTCEAAGGQWISGPSRFLSTDTLKIDLSASFEFLINQPDSTESPDE